MYLGPAGGFQSGIGEERRALIGAAASTASSPHTYSLPELREHDCVCEHVCSHRLVVFCEVGRGRNKLCTTVKVAMTMRHCTLELSKCIFVLFLLAYRVSKKIMWHFQV